MHRHPDVLGVRCQPLDIVSQVVPAAQDYHGDRPPSGERARGWSPGRAADKPLRDITPGDADSWRVWLMGQSLAENTVRRRCGFAKQFLRAAVRRRLITENPFADIQGTTVKGIGIATTSSRAMKPRRNWSSARMAPMRTCERN